MLSLNNIEVSYLGVILVLKGVSLDVNPGQIITLLGANGAGKSTTLKAISGLLRTEEGRVSEGSITFENKRIDNSRPQDIAKMGIIQVLEGRRVLKHLSVEENLMAGANMRRNTAEVKRDVGMVFDYFPVLKNLSRKTSGYISGGEQQMLVLGRALMARPKVMLLDEPSLGLAPLMIKEIYAIVRRINDEEKSSILLVEQNARAALSLAEYGYVMENGRIVLSGPAEQLKENEEIKEFYLGLSSAEGMKNYRDLKHYKRKKRWF